MEEAAQEAHDTHSFSLLSLIYLYMDGYLDWKLQALPSSALTPLSADAVRMAACVKVDAELHKAVPSTLTGHTFPKTQEEEIQQQNGQNYDFKFQLYCVILPLTYHTGVETSMEIFTEKFKEKLY